MRNPRETQISRKEPGRFFCGLIQNRGRHRLCRPLSSRERSYLPSSLSAVFFGLPGRKGKGCASWLLPIAAKPSFCCHAAHIIAIVRTQQPGEFCDTERTALCKNAERPKRKNGIKNSFCVFYPHRTWVFRTERRRFVTGKAEKQRCRCKKCRAYIKNTKSPTDIFEGAVKNI